MRETWERRQSQPSPKSPQKWVGFPPSSMKLWVYDWVHHITASFWMSDKNIEKRHGFFLAILKFYRVTSPWTSSAFLQNLSSGCGD